MAEERARIEGWSPRDGIDSDAMGGEDFMFPSIVFELEHRYVPVRRGAGEDTTSFVRGPRHQVD